MDNLNVWDNIICIYLKATWHDQKDAYVLWRKKPRREDKTGCVGLRREGGDCCFNLK